MVILLWLTTLQDESFRREHEDGVTAMRALAERTPGFVSWDDYRSDDGASVGVIHFETMDALAQWRDDPSHAEIHKRGVEEMYASYKVEVAEVVRSAGKG